MSHKPITESLYELCKIVKTVMKEEKVLCADFSFFSKLLKQVVPDSVRVTQHLSTHFSRKNPYYYVDVLESTLKLYVKSLVHPVKLLPDFEIHFSRLRKYFDGE